MAAIIKGDLWITPARLMHFARNIVFGVPCSHKHVWKDGHHLGATLHTAVDTCLNDRLRKLQKPTLHNAGGVLVGK